MIPGELYKVLFRKNKPIWLYKHPHSSPDDDDKLYHDKTLKNFRLEYSKNCFILLLEETKNSWKILYKNQTGWIDKEDIENLVHL